MTQPPIYVSDAAFSPMPRGHLLGHWRWEIRDGGPGGPVVASGRTLTRRGAYGQREQAHERCERRILHPGRVRHRLTAVEASAICQDLAALDVHVTLRRNGDAVDVEPVGVVDTTGEVWALRAVKAVTDQPVHWHKAEAVSAR